MSFERAIELAGLIPSDDAHQVEKKAYSELLSRELAFEIAALLSARKVFKAISPRRPKEIPKLLGSQKRLAALNKESPEKYFLGGFGRKKLDVSLADEQDGLLFALSVKTITSRDKRSGNYNKNFKNRFGDLCAEATSVHMRSPYTFMAGVFAMPTSAAFDNTKKRTATALRAIRYLKSISGRLSHEQSPEKFECMTFMLFDPILPEVHEHDTIARKVHDFRFSGSDLLDGGARYRLFDVSSAKEITAEEFVIQMEQGFLARNPFLEDDL